jgi:hypothetical protein
MVEGTGHRYGNGYSGKWRELRDNEHQQVAQTAVEHLCAQLNTPWGIFREESVSAGQEDIQSALILVCLRAKCAEKEGAAVVEGIGGWGDGWHAVARINNDESLSGDGRRECQRTHEKMRAS